MSDDDRYDIPCYEPIKKEFDWKKFIIDGVCYCPLCKAMGWNGYSSTNQRGKITHETFHTTIRHIHTAD